MKQNKHSISTESIEVLKKRIFVSLGRNISTHSDCLLLADNIYLKTKRNIGITTLRRFFGLDTSNNLPSKYTLDTLSIYCGKDSWFEFINKNITRYFPITIKSNGENEEYDWDEIKQLAYQVSQYSMQTLQNKSGLPYNYTILREWSVDYIESFINSPYSATAFIAPGGMGKSIMITQAIKKLWFSANPTYPDDIVWFFDAKMISGLIALGFDFSRWLAAQLGIDPNNNYRKFFNVNRAKRKGRMIFIIDSVDEITERGGKLNDIFSTIISLVALNDETPWFKIILTMRNYTWGKFISAQTDYPIIQNQWFSVNFKIYSNVFSNVELLTEYEIIKIVDNFCTSLTEEISRNVKSTILDANIMQFLSYPKYLQIFLNSVKENNYLVSNVYVMQQYIKLKLLNGYYQDEKQEIIRTFLEGINYGLSGESVVRKELLNQSIIRDLNKAYNELVVYGIFNEEYHYNKYGTLTTKVKFGIDDLLEYFIAMHFFNTMDKDIKNTLSFVSTSYSNEMLKRRIVKWLLLINNHYKLELANPIYI